MTLKLTFIRDGKTRVKRYRHVHLIMHSPDSSIFHIYQVSGRNFKVDKRDLGDNITIEVK